MMSVSRVKSNLQFSFNLKWILCLLAVGVSCLANSYAVFALQPSPAQLEGFKKLSVSEQRRLAASFGVDIPTGSSKPNLNSPVTSEPTVQPRVVSSSKEIDELADLDVASDKPNEELVFSAKDEVDDLAELKPFGYNLFAGAPSTFAPATDIPVPANYVVGPGDSIIIQLYGKDNETHELVVSREGVIQFPSIGPITINGLNFTELRERIDKLVGEQMIGVKASVTMGSLRSIHVFVLGEAYKPGTYTISSLSTMTHALFASGGIKTIGSLRNIQLKRNGEVVATLDLYDLLLEGDTSNDVHLLPGDVIFVPTIGATASISGEVRRPAIYELKGEATAAELVRLAGGFRPTAYPKASRVDRIDAYGNRTVLDLDLSLKAEQKRKLRNGDLVTIYSVLDKLENIVLLSGHVHRPGYFTWRKGMRVSDIIRSISDMKPNPDLTIGLIKHEKGPERRITFDHFNVRGAITAKGNKRSKDNPLLQPRDEVIVFSAGSDSRVAQLGPYVNKLRNQGSLTEPAEVVEIKGSVRADGAYPLTKGMTNDHLIALAGGLLDEARGGSALLINRADRAGRGEMRYRSLSNETLPSLSTSLQPGSQVMVLSNESASERRRIVDPLIDEILSQSWHGEPAPIITIGGAVRFPGEYPYIDNLKVDSLIELAGGLREEAYLFSAEVTRRHIEVGSAFEVRHHTLDLSKKDQGGLAYALQPRDKMVIKQVPEWGETINVSILGEVRFPGTYPIIRGENLIQLIERAGGLTSDADPVGAIFLRESVKKKEKKALEDYKDQLNNEIARLEQHESADDLSEQKKEANRKLLQDLEKSEALGRLVVNLPLMLKGKHKPLVLRENDQLTIPRLTQEVSIVGEVQYPTSYLYERKVSVKEYLKLSGGVTRDGDMKRGYIISRSGSVSPLTKRRFLWVFKKYARVEPGDTVVVPLDTQPISPLSYWTQASQILFQLATTAAALETVGAL